MERINLNKDLNDPVVVSELTEWSNSVDLNVTFICVDLTTVERNEPTVATVLELSLSHYGEKIKAQLVTKTADITVDRSIADRAVFTIRFEDEERNKVRNTHERLDPDTELAPQMSRFFTDEVQTMQNELQDKNDARDAVESVTDNLSQLQSIVADLPGADDLDRL